MSDNARKYSDLKPVQATRIVNAWRAKHAPDLPEITTQNMFGLAGKNAGIGKSRTNAVIDAYTVEGRGGVRFVGASFAAWFDTYRMTGVFRSGVGSASLRSLIDEYADVL